MDDIFGDIFGDMFHGQGGSTRRGRSGFGSGFSGNSGFRGYQDFGGRQNTGRGSDLRSEVSVSFKEAVFGCDRMLQLSDPNGKSQKLQVHIPAGIEDGKSIRLKGKGNPGYGGGASGDLFLKVHVEPETGWERKGQDIYTIAEIPFMTAVLGGEAKFSTLYGDVMCRIPAGTQCGGKNQAERKRGSFHAESFCKRRPVCDHTDPGAKGGKQRGGPETERIRNGNGQKLFRQTGKRSIKRFLFLLHTKDFWDTLITEMKSLIIWQRGDMFGRISEGTCNAYIDHYKYCGVSYGGIYGTFSGYASYAGLGSSLYAADRRKRGSLSSVYQYVSSFLGLNT